MRPNRFEGFCDACRAHVAAGSGALTGTPGRWRTWCVACSPKPPSRGDHDGWHRLPLASLDFETTGIDPHTDRVLSYALLDLPGFEITGLVNPGVPIPEAAAQVHGITEAMLVGQPALTAQPRDDRIGIHVTLFHLTLQGVLFRDARSSNHLTCRTGCI